jgi:hypothetical protein
MKDSILAVPFYDIMTAEEEERANEKQMVYDSFLEEHGSLFKMVKNMKTHDAFNFLKDCMCCHMHQINKPKKLVKRTDHQAGLELHLNQEEKSCKCDCRQLARGMCKGIMKPFGRKKKKIR